MPLSPDTVSIIDTVLAMEEQESSYIRNINLGHQFDWICLSDP